MADHIDTEALQKLLDKATPGPWIFYADLPSNEPNWHIVTPESRMRVLANVHIEQENRMDIANARLIALAPALARRVIAAEKLAEAIREISYRFGEGDITRQEIESALSAWEADQ